MKTCNLKDITDKSNLDASNLLVSNIVDCLIDDFSCKPGVSFVWLSCRIGFVFEETEIFSKTPGTNTSEFKAECLENGTWTNPPKCVSEVTIANSTSLNYFEESQTSTQSQSEIDSKTNSSKAK